MGYDTEIFPMSSFESAAAKLPSSPDERPSGKRRRAKLVVVPEEPVDVTAFAKLEEDEAAEEIKDLTPFARETGKPALETLTDDDLEVETSKYDEVFSKLEDVPASYLQEFNRQKKDVQKENASRRLQEGYKREREEKEKTKQHLDRVRASIARPTRVSKDAVDVMRAGIEADIIRANNAAIAEDEAAEGKFLPKVDAYLKIAEGFRSITRELPFYLKQRQTADVKAKIAALHAEAKKLSEWKRRIDEAEGLGPRALVENPDYERPASAPPLTADVDEGDQDEAIPLIPKKKGVPAPSDAEAPNHFNRAA